MSGLSQRIAALSPEKRQLLLRRLKALETQQQEISQQGEVAVPGQARPLRAYDRTGCPQFPLSFAQQRLWFLDQLEPESTVYLLPTALHWQGRLQVQALEQSLSEVLSRHDSLRTTFQIRDQQAVQVIHDALGFLLPVIDLQGLEQKQRDEQVRRLAQQETQQPMSLSVGPLLRAYLLRCSSREHVFLLTLHHIITDGWSNAILVRELTTLYRAQASGQPQVLPPLPIQYADYALWQREWLQGEVLEAQLAYWQKRLANVPPLTLPTDYPRPAVPTYRGAIQAQILPQALSVGLMALSQQEHVTLFMLLLSAFQVLLARYSGETDIPVGTPIANRTQAEIERVIGFFANTLVLRTNLSGNPTFVQVLQRVREVCLGAYTHQDIPFEKVVAELEPARDLSHSPLFQVMFVQNAPRELESGDLAGVNVRPLEVESGTSKFDLTLLIIETEQGLVCVLEYSTDLFEADTIARWLTNLQTLLEGVLQNPQTQIWNLPLLTEREQKQLLMEWNTTQADYPQDVCLHHLFEQQVEQTPESISVAFEGQQISYRYLNAQANHLASRLLEERIGPERLVGVYMQRSLELVVALLAVLKAGGAYVPLDPSSPQDRLAFLLEDAQIPLVITHAPLHGQLTPFAGLTISVVDELACQGSTSIDPLPHGNPNSWVQPENLAYLIYTSGSTGKPKGVMVTHRSLSNHMLWMQERFPLSATDRVLQKTPCGFDASVWELYAPLLAGACLILACPDGHRDSGYLLEVIAREQISTLQVVPSLLHLLLDGVTACQSLQRLFCGGEELGSDLLVRALAQLPVHCQLSNLYGPTECTVDATFWICEREVVHQGKPAGSHKIPIGHPIANTQIYLLDQNLSPVPRGARGELYIGGVGLSRGYVGRPELTVEKFIPKPFGEIAGERLYRTGDVARYRPDGAIEYLGRIDQQVKLRGFRIELGEIEATLRGYPEIQEVVVVLQEESEKRRYLVAYLVRSEEPSDAGANPEAAVQEYLRERLPDYMIPTFVVELSSMPLLPNGKVDRKALPAPPVSQGSQPTALSSRSEVEQRLSAIWQQVLGLSQVGMHDNFFALGGDSILSLQVIARTRQVGLRLTLKQLFQHQTLAELARVAQPLSRDVEAQQAEALGPVPLTPIQRWFFEQKPPVPQHFNQAVLLQVPASWDLRHLQQMVEAWLTQHEALRLRYEETETGWQQRLVSLAEAGTVAVERLDLTHIEAGEQAREIEKVANRMQASLELQRGPLLRVVFFDLGKGQPARLLIVIHHLVIDGVSWRVLLSDLQLAMTQLQRNEPISLPAATVSFPRWAKYLPELVESAWQNERVYWLEAAQVQTVPLPLDFPEGSNTEACARTVSLTLTAEETRLLLQEAPQPYHSHVQELLLAALVQTLTRWMGAQTIRLDLEGHGREDLGTETLDVSRTVGWFTSLYPVLFTLPPESGAAAWIKHLKEQLRTVPHKGIGYGLLRYLSADEELKKQLASAPSSQVCFNYLGQFASVLSGEETPPPSPESSGETSSPQNSRSYVLDVSALVVGGLLRLQWTYSEQLHRRATIEALAQECVQALRDLLAHCLSPSAGGWTPSDFPLANLEQTTLDGLKVFHKKQIEDIYPLTPLQQGILFHTLYAPHSGVYIEQMSYLLRGAFDRGAFERAWQQVVRQHSILRTAFVWQELPEPLQIVFEQVKLSVHILDWSRLPLQQQQVELEALLKIDGVQDFDLVSIPSSGSEKDIDSYYLSEGEVHIPNPNKSSGNALGQAPLMRLTFVRLSERRTQVIWTFHHLLLDGWSVSLLLEEVLACYEAEIRGEHLLLEERRPYRDYIAWLTRRGSQASETYWRQALAGITAPTPLGVETACELVSAGGSEPEQKYAEEVWEVDAVTTAKWQEFAGDQHVTLNTLVQAAWALVLSRYSGQTDVIFGTVVAGRPPELAGVERMLGLFINTVPVRVQVRGEEQVGAWLTRLLSQQMEQRSYEYSSLIQVQGWSEIPREHALFESLLVFENYPLSTALAERKSQLEIEAVRVKEQTNYPLTLSINPGKGENKPLRLLASYDRLRFEQAGIQRLLLHWQNCLQQLVEHPQQQLQEVSLLTQAEREQLLAQWNATQTDWTPDVCVQQLFEQQVEQNPDSVAAVSEEVMLTYRELNRQANQLASRLQDLGVGPEVLVGLCLSRSIEMLVGLLAVLKAGGAYVPLDPELPQERFAFLLEDAQVSLVLVHAHLQEQLTPFGIRTICVDSDAPTGASPMAPSRLASDAPQKGDYPANPVQPDNLAYLIYTSGSTGKPKGVVNTHHALVNRLRWSQQAFPLTSGDRVLQIASVNFDIALWELFGPLIAGAQVLLAPGGLAQDSRALVNWLIEQAITVAHAVPSLLRVWLQEPAFGQAQDLHQFFCGGEAWWPGLARRFREEHSAHLTQWYGPTEAAISVTSWTCPAPSTESTTEPEVAPIGCPIANCEVYLLDAHGLPVPVGVRGEIYLGGSCLARGYMRQAALTAERFVPHPWSKHPGARLYRTGDRARYRPDGTLEYLGRLDQQIKLRGFRIELGEIATILCQHPDVQESVVVLQDEDEARQYLAAYVVPSDAVGRGGQVPLAGSLASTLQGYLRKRLPDYMIPTRVVFLEGIPLSPNGKIDRKALPVLDSSQFPEKESVATQTPLQEQLALIWADLLHLPQVGIHQHFFELGGHSLLATQFIARLRSIFEVEVPLRRLFETPTIAGMALAIEQIQQEQIEQAANEELAQMLRGLGGLSEDDMRAVFANGYKKGEQDE